MEDKNKKGWVVCATTKRGKLSIDHWERFHEEDGDTLSDARARYLELLNVETVYCASLCEELESEKD